MVFQILQCSLNEIIAPRGILPREANDSIHEDLSNSWSADFSFRAGIKLLRHEFAVPADDRVRRKDSGQFQGLAADGVSFSRRAVDAGRHSEAVASGRVVSAVPQSGRSETRSSAAGVHWLSQWGWQAECGRAGA